MNLNHPMIACVGMNLHSVTICETLAFAGLPNVGASGQNRNACASLAMRFALFTVGKMQNIKKCQVTHVKIIRDLPWLFSILEGLQEGSCHISNRPWALNWPWNVKSSNCLVVMASAVRSRWIYGNSSKSGTNMAQKHVEILIFMEPRHKSPVSTDDSFKLGVLFEDAERAPFCHLWGPYSPPEECGAEPSHGPLWSSGCISSIAQVSWTMNALETGAQWRRRLVWQREWPFWLLYKGKKL